MSFRIRKIIYRKIRTNSKSGIFYYFPQCCIFDSMIFIRKITTSDCYQMKKRKQTSSLKNTCSVLYQQVLGKCFIIIFSTAVGKSEIYPNFYQFISRLKHTTLVFTSLQALIKTGFNKNKL